MTSSTRQKVSARVLSGPAREMELLGSVIDVASVGGYNMRDCAYLISRLPPFPSLSNRLRNQYRACACSPTPPRPLVDHPVLARWGAIMTYRELRTQMCLTKSNMAHTNKVNFAFDI